MVPRPASRKDPIRWKKRSRATSSVRSASTAIAATLAAADGVARESLDDPGPRWHSAPRSARPRSRTGPDCDWRPGPGRRTPPRAADRPRGRGASSTPSRAGRAPQGQPASDEARGRMLSASADRRNQLGDQGAEHPAVLRGTDHPELLDRVEGSFEAVRVHQADQGTQGRHRRETAGLPSVEPLARSDQRPEQLRGEVDATDGEAQSEEPVDIHPDQLQGHDREHPCVPAPFVPIQKREHRRQQEEGGQLRPGHEAVRGHQQHQAQAQRRDPGPSHADGRWAPGSRSAHTPSAPSPPPPRRGRRGNGARGDRPDGASGCRCSGRPGPCRCRCRASGPRPSRGSARQSGAATSSRRFGSSVARG